MPPRLGTGFLLACFFLIEGVFTKLPERVAKQPNNILVDFFAYRHVSIIHFDIPENTVSVGFKFTVKEEKTGGIGNCEPRAVTIHLKSGSLPFVNPDESKILAKVLYDRRTHYTLEVISDGNEHLFTIDAPVPGDWYAVAFRSWYDPNNGKIKQQENIATIKNLEVPMNHVEIGLSVSCDTVLDAELSIESPDKLLLLGDGFDSMTTELQIFDTAVMRFQVPENVGGSNLTVRSSCTQDCRLSVHVTATDHILGEIMNNTVTSLSFWPHMGSTHFVILKLLTGSASNVTVEMKNEITPENVVTNTKLTRKTLPDFFLFDYDHVSENESKPMPMNLTVGTLSVLKFKIGAVYDIGGTLSVGLKIADCEDENRNIMLIGCVSYGHFSNVTSSLKCVRAAKSLPAPADIVVSNYSDPSFVHVPYPEPGNWYLSVKAFCHGKPLKSSGSADTTCECAEQCALNSACTECDCIHECNAKIETSVASSPCIEGACNSHGKCVNYMSGGFVYSACHCTGGYRGFDCADDKYVLSRAKTLMTLLFLTTSNLAFIGAIYVAIRREYYTETIAYTAVMFFSTMYHACEAGEEGHTFCIMKLSVLQFCDFFNALLSIWVTLVAMAGFGPKATSFCQMLGVVILAVGAESDRTALWVFLLPAVTGCIIVSVSWAMRCRQKGTLQYPARRYQLIYLPIGLVIVFAGLISYAFFQTRKNYYIVHSIWHICVAVGVMFMLPKKEYLE